MYTLPSSWHVMHKQQFYFMNVFCDPQPGLSVFQVYQGFASYAESSEVLVLKSSLDCVPTSRGCHFFHKSSLNESELNPTLNGVLFFKWLKHRTQRTEMCNGPNTYSLDFNCHYYAT